MAKPSKSSGIGLGRALRLLLVCICLASPALGYLHKKNQLVLLGNEYRDLEVRLEKLRRDNGFRTRTIELLKTPSHLETAVREMNLGLVAPSPDQIVRLGPSAGAKDPLDLAGNSEQGRPTLADARARP